MPRPNRRQFTLGLSAACATAVLPRARAASPNDTVGVAIAGVNGRGTTHMAALSRDPRTHIAVLVDIDEKVGYQRAEQVAKVQGHRPEVVTDVRRVLDNKDVEILSCATPNHWHALMGVWAMQAGKDVYLEKPVSHNVQEGRALVAAAAKYGRMLQTGTQCRSSTACIDAVKFLAEGGIGEVRLARGLCYKRRKSIGSLGDYPLPPEVDFDLWSGPATFTQPQLTRPKFHYDWHWQRHYGNGDLGNQGPHQTDVARWGLGLDRHPQAILSYGGRLGYQAERNDADYVDAGDTANTEVSIYDYGDKCIVFETRGLDVDDSADAELNQLFGSAKGNKVGVVFYGSGGYLVQTGYGSCTAYDREMNVIRQFRHRTTREGRYGDLEPGKISLDDEHFGNFLDACANRDAGLLHADALTGHLSAAVSHLGNISYYLGETQRATPTEIAEALGAIASLDDDRATLDRTVRHLQDNGVDLEQTPLSLGQFLQFDPDTERFTNHEAANGLLTREYRPGFECPPPDRV
jgi:predicted dehydrogenase